MVGMIIMYLRGANGWELIPHVEFWRDLPSLVKVQAHMASTSC